MRAQRVNLHYLPDAPFPDQLQVADSIESALAGVGDVVIAVPSNAFRSLLQELAPRITTEMRVAWATKGFEHHTGLLPNQVAREVLGNSYAMAVLSGPTFAQEVGRGLPTAMVVASADADFARRIAEDLASPSFRTYISTDITGVEIGGAVKNVIAVGAGLSDGLGFGANMRVALITRGLAEMTRLGVALGANPATFAGLAGLGDLVLTCTGGLSRNRTLGVEIGQGHTLAEVLEGKQTVAEGVDTTVSTVALAKREGVEMPIAAMVSRILFEGQTALAAVQELMARDLRAEQDR
jgi:glycerol-3-phosphate dehydrogenase (NAD(P)+)